MQPERRKTWYCRIALVAALLALLAPPALADTRQWVGPTTNTNWNNPSNWQDTTTLLPGVPLAADNAFLISTTGSKTATLNTVTPLLAAVAVDATSGTFTLNQNGGGSALNSVEEAIGYSGQGVYNQSAGSNTTDALVLGFDSGSTGTYNQSGGSVTVNGLLNVGLTGTGTYNQSGGSLTADGISIGTGWYLGIPAIGTFNQFGGNVTINGEEPELVLAQVLDSIGSYKMFSGTLSVGGGEFVGGGGKGTFTQFSGIHTIGGGLSIGNQNGSTGTFTLYSGILKVTGDEDLGFDGTGIGSTGTFTQFSGSQTVGGSLYVGYGVGSTPFSGIGTFTIYSGTLKVTGDEYLGYINATGGFTQTSGNHQIGGSLTLGRNSGSSGTYNLQGGTLTVSNITIGDEGTGVFTQTGGINTVTNTLTLAATSGSSSGTYNFTGGILSTGAIQINAGGAFNVTGLSRTITGDVTNNGTVKTTNANVTWSGNFTNNGAYISDPSTQTFNQDLVVGTTGYLMGLTSQDLFIIKNNFQNQSTDATDWNTVQASLKFITGTDNRHDFYIAGEDVGPTPEANNFNWGLLNITNQNIYLEDGNPTNTNNGVDGAQYVKILLGANVNYATKVVNNIFGDLSHELNIYYDPTETANAYLKGLDYSFASGLGHLLADPPTPSGPQLLTTYPTTQNISLTDSNAYTFTGGLGQLRADDRISSEPLPLNAYPYADWQMYDF